MPAEQAHLFTGTGLCLNGPSGNGTTDNRWPDLSEISTVQSRQFLSSDAEAIMRLAMRNACRRAA